MIQDNEKEKVALQSRAVKAEQLVQSMQEHLSATALDHQKQLNEL